MSDRIRQISKFVHDAIQKSARQRLHDQSDEEHLKGFSSAADISLHRMQEKLDASTERMRGPGLSKPEQVIHVQLEELKCALEADFDRYWRDSGVDWRPPKPAANVVIGHPTDS